MLTIHDYTFQVRWSGCGIFSPHAERVATSIMLDLLGMSPESVKRLAQSPRELALTRQVARAYLKHACAARGKPMPPKANIVLEVIACPK